MRTLPGNIFTFLFTDIEGSTRLAYRLKRDYPQLLERHRAVVREAIRENMGLEVDTAGDGFFIVFLMPIQAVRTAIMIQQAFAQEEWASEAELKVRMGIHTGEGLATETGFTGLEVHRASRICQAGYGGQVLISSSTCKELEECNLPEGVKIKEIGSFRLKDFDQSQVLHQLIIPGIKADFPLPNLRSSKPKIAVLPFDNLSTHTDQDYFCEGIADEIILALDGVPGIRVAARSSSFAMKGRQMDAMTIGKQLQVNAVLEGSVRQQNGSLRISVQLVDTHSGLNIWSNRFDRQHEDVFAIQDEIANSIASSLEIEFFPVQKGYVQERQTSNVQAYDCYLKGRLLFYEFSTSSVCKALEMFQKAIDLDSTYALAYSGQADCFAYLYLYVECSEEYLSETDRSSRMAVDLDPSLAEAHASRGMAMSLMHEYKEAEKAFEKSIELNPHLFEAWYQYGRCCYAQGKMDKAARLFEEASSVRPEDFQAILLAGQVYAALGIAELAYKARQKGIAIVKKELKFNPDNTRALYLGANGLIGLGDKKKGILWLKRALEIDAKDSMLLYNAACVYAQVGMHKEALDCLENSYTAGLTQLGWFEHDNDLDSLRELPRFKALLERMR